MAKEFIKDFYGRVLGTVETIGTKVENQITEAKSLKTNQVPKTRNKFR